MRGDEISKKLKGTLNNLATADPLWLLKKERIRPSVYKGIMPDVGLALCTKVGSTFNLDTLLFTEIIDYTRATFAWYCRQKQFDAKAMNEAGIPYFGNVKAPKHVSWFFQFPLTKLTFIRGSDRIMVPKYLGYQCPLITLEQAAKLGAIFKASNLFWDGHNINTYSFEYIMRHLDLIVVENREVINSQTENLFDAFIPEDALQIMQQFGVNPETRIAGEDVFFTLVEYIFGENGLGQEIGAMEVTVNHHQFWENIRAIQSMVGSALATQIIQTYFMTPSLGVKR